MAVVSVPLICLISVKVSSRRSGAILNYIHDGTLIDNVQDVNFSL